MLRLGTDSRSITQRADFNCRHCGAFRVATVTAIGMGAGYFGTAERNARADAEAAVPMLLALCRCPECGYRDEALARRNVRTRSIVLAIIIASIVATLGTLAALAWSDRYLLAAVGVAAPLLALVAVAYRRALWARYPDDADGVVELGPPTSTPAWRPAATDDVGPWKWI
jgi:hypothetical protein